MTGDQAVFIGCAIAFGVLLALPQPTQPPVIVYKAFRPLMQWNCDKQEFREHAHVCAHRLMSDKIKENK